MRSGRYRNILDAEVASISGADIMLNIHGKEFKVVQENLNHTIGDKVRIVVRPKAIAVGVKDGFKAKVEKSVYMGNTQDYELEYDGLILTVTDYNPMGKNVYSEGEAVEFMLQPDSVYIL